MKICVFKIDLNAFILLTRSYYKISLTNQNAKVRSQDIPGVTSKFDLGEQNEAGQRLIEFCQENALVIENTLFQKCKRQLHIWTSSNGQY